MLEQADDGTYLIYTADDLKEFAAIVNGTDDAPADNDADARLMNDIVLNEKIEVDDNGAVTNQKELSEWTPIGTSSSRYSGTFDGNGKTISGLYIDSSSANYQGLFGYVSGTVQDLSVSGSVSVSGGEDVGGIVGYNSFGTVTNCAFSGSVSGNRSVGGVVGENLSGRVENSYNTGAVSGGEYVGGVVGYNYSGGSVTNSYNTGAVSGLDSVSGNSVGGVVGLNSSGIVENCHNIGEVSGYSYVGGVVGQNGGTVENCYNTGAVNSSGNYVGGVVGYNISSVTNCYNTGTVTGSGNSVGGVVGYNISSVTNCYNTGNISGGNQVGGVVGENSGIVTDCYFLKQNPEIPGIGGGGEEIGATAESVNDLDTLCQKFTSDTWTISENLNRPVLKDNHEDDGSEQHPYEIFTATQLENFRDLVNDEIGNPAAWAVLMENITLNSSEEWTPIGTSEENAYTGTFDGNGKTIENLYINTTTNDYYQGLFGYVGSSGKIEKLSVSGDINGGIYVGGVVGDNSGTVTNCAFSGSVSGHWDVGGVVGYNGGSVENCYNTGAVSGSGLYVGGVVGQNSDTVENCYNIGKVSGTGVGGVVGYNDGDSVTNCYFLSSTAASGIGNGSGTSSNVEARTDDAFHSGEVAWLLENGQADGSSQVWGQNLMNEPKDNYPQLRAFDADTPQVYKVAFMNDSEEHDAKYANSGMTVGSPTTNPTKEGHTFKGWFTESSGGSQWNFSTAVTENMTLYAQWTAVEEPTPTPDPEPSGPSTGDSTGWDDIRDELENAENGDQITIDMGDETKVPAEIFESLAGKDVEISFDLGDVQWSVNGADIPTDTDFTDLDLGVNLDTSGIPVNVINTITGEVGTVQITLAHDGEFGFTMTLSAPLGEENAGYWANLYHYDEEAEKLNFEAAAEIDEDGNVKIPFTHASQYAIVIDTHSHAAVDVSDIFIDIAPDAWYKDAIQYAYDNGLMTGVSATEFDPEATTTRAMIVSILARLEGVESAQAAGFADVTDEWYATAVNWAANVGVVNGYEDNTFKPNTAITREQLAAILMNYAAYKGEDVSNRASLATYTDQPSTWATETMQWAVAEGLISGVTADTLQPQGAATRAQVAAILQRFLEA